MLADSKTIGWEMLMSTVYDEDSGVESIRIKHTYEGPLKANQEIRFELVFYSSSDPFIDRKQFIEADSAVCKMTRSTTDTRFWILTTQDLYYKCDTETCGTAAVPAFPDPSKVQTDVTNNWTTPIKDDNPDDLMCVPYTPAEIAKDPYLGQFACKQISCTYQRPLITKDAQDFNFYAVSTSAKKDKMILPQQRSNIAIGFVANAVTVVYGASKGETVDILAGAFSSLLANTTIMGSVVACYLLF